jgi:hypothetical protein
MSEFLTAYGSSPLEIHRRLRIVYGEDAIDVGSVRCWVRLLRTVKKILVTGPQQPTSDGSDFWESGILRERGYNKFRAICTDIK